MIESMYYSKIIIEYYDNMFFCREITHILVSMVKKFLAKKPFLSFCDMEILKSHSYINGFCQLYDYLEIRIRLILKPSS